MRQASAQGLRRHRLFDEIRHYPRDLMNISEFGFDLPADLIAQEPAPVRGTSRMLVLRRASGETEHADVGRLPDYLRAGDLLVVNDSKVFPARLLGNRASNGSLNGGAVECLLLSKLDDDRWDALVHPGQKLQPGAQMIFRGNNHALHAEVLDCHFHGRRTIRLSAEGGSVEDAVDAIGHVPLPPYIKREDGKGDRDRYQTVYARERGSVAAPTAGLHFTPELLTALEERGVERAAITLHVGYGTFQPVRVTPVEAHTVNPERFSISESAAEAINRAKKDRRRIVAVGTTTTRALETAARAGRGVITPQAGWTDLFIYPGFTFRIVTALMTNFHLPHSSLLMLVSAFGGREAVLAAYRDAVARNYQFYSYGDAMLIL
jgi:S-adenosylmethionine:tRNA ribosyltransferase-isomerase